MIRSVQFSMKSRGQKGERLIFMFQIKHKTRFNRGDVCLGVSSLLGGE